MTTCAATALFAFAATSACSSPDETPATGRETGRLGKTPAFDVDITQTSASGLSSGGFMAVQFNVAFSSIMRGVAVFAGGPFTCSDGNVTNALTRCMASSQPLDATQFVASTTAYSNAGAIDSIAHIETQRVFLFGGAEDKTVNASVVDALRDYYLKLGVPASELTYERRRAGTAHTMPTLDYGGDCGASAPPYVGSCGYDGAGEALTRIYGTLEPRVTTPTGKFIEIPQGDFISSPSSHSLADTAWAYVPTSCSSGEACRIHVAFHGCKQSTSKVGDAFYKHAGYNEWADANHLIVLYPQTIPTFGSNPNGCWDWWGYDSPNYATKTGPQMAMVRAIVDRLAGGLTVSSLPSDDDAGATSDDAGATSDDAGATSDGSDAGAEMTCIAASNEEHVAAGRAYTAYGYTFALGSNQALGLYSSLVRVGLSRVAPYVYVLGACW